jgi:dTDP-4-dehydrorhamnose 3,5-epimerase
MIIEPQEVPGCFLIRLEPKTDERGFFARAFSVEEFAAVGMVTEIAQINLARSETVGTLRGIHWQEAPFEEAKLVRCIRGSVFDVCVDVRTGSETWGRSVGVELSAQNHLALYVPPGCGHGYQSLEDGSEVIYSTSVPYAAEAESGARWDDPALDIDWPIKEGLTLSEKDGKWPDLG